MRLIQSFFLYMYLFLFVSLSKVFVVGAPKVLAGVLREDLLFFPFVQAYCTHSNLQSLVVEDHPLWFIYVYALFHFLLQRLQLKFLGLFFFLSLFHVFSILFFFLSLFVLVLRKFSSLTFVVIILVHKLCCFCYSIWMSTIFYSR